MEAPIQIDIDQKNSRRRASISRRRSSSRQPSLSRSEYHTFQAWIIIHLRQGSMEPWLIEYGTIFRKETRKDFLLINITETVLRIVVYSIATCNNLILLSQFFVNRKNNDRVKWRKLINTVLFFFCYLLLQLANLRYLKFICKTTLQSSSNAQNDLELKLTSKG